MTDKSKTKERQKPLVDEDEEITKVILELPLPPRFLIARAELSAKGVLAEWNKMGDKHDVVIYRYTEWGALVQSVGESLLGTSESKASEHFQGFITSALGGGKSVKVNRI